ncbi:hypothetical protein C8F04DRAFT_1078649 [Mycena alexandri]|uniref:Uncharacterized protein n=1 Tax=Mycena alexandri TaxID=1745969 RepID=A0AAD6X7E0_9AGAR|nr:hypothetical protein C8F04DRAFT_1078649 [Mycena alexandri]
MPPTPTQTQTRTQTVDSSKRNENAPGADKEREGSPLLRCTFRPRELARRVVVGGERARVHPRLLLQLLKLVVLPPSTRAITCESPRISPPTPRKIKMPPTLTSTNAAGGHEESNGEQKQEDIGGGSPFLTCTFRWSGGLSLPMGSRYVHSFIFILFFCRFFAPCVLRRRGAAFARRASRVVRRASALSSSCTGVDIRDLPSAGWGLSDGRKAVKCSRAM